MKTEVQYEINHFETRGCVSPLFQQKRYTVGVCELRSICPSVRPSTLLFVGKAFKTSYDQLTGYDTC